MISSYNEWDSLKSIVVGTATNANWPINDPVFAMEKFKTTWTETPVPSGPVPQWIIDESNEDLDALAKTLVDLGVEVLRPHDINFPALDGMYNYCPRDRLFIYGDTIFDVPMMYPCRDIEIDALSEVTARGKVVTLPRNRGIVLDAANICRLGDTLLFLKSASGNHEAYEWLSDRLINVKVELCDFYSGVHIDSTIVPLREGLVLVNASRVTPSNLPKVFRNWEVLYIDDVVAQGFHEYPYASKWIALNMLVVDPNTVIVDRHQSALIALLEQRNFTVIPLELRHSRTLGGGFHCVTLDLVRIAK